MTRSHEKHVICKRNLLNGGQRAEKGQIPEHENMCAVIQAITKLSWVHWHGEQPFYRAHYKVYRAHYKKLEKSPSQQDSAVKEVVHTQCVLDPARGRH